MKNICQGTYSIMPLFCEISFFPPQNIGIPRIYRAKSHQGPERLELPTQGRIQRAYSQCGEVPITLPPLKTSPHGGRRQQSQKFCHQLLLRRRLAIYRVVIRKL